MKGRNKMRLKFFSVVFLAVAAGLISYPKMLSFAPPAMAVLEKMKINLGLDLQGGIHLEYAADVAGIEGDKRDEALQAAQDVIERRVNAYGVGESLVQAAQSGGEYRIIVELPGIKDVEEAKNMIKETPILEFRKEAGEDSEGKKIIDEFNEQAEKRAHDLLIRALGGEDFEVMAKENSHDLGSREDGGNLDFTKRGELVPEFEQIIFDAGLKDGEVYGEVIETQFGWHIIQKMEERGEGEEREVRSRHILQRKTTFDTIPELMYEPTELTGRHLTDAQVAFANQGLTEPQVSLRFDNEGSRIFAQLTKDNIGKTIAILLDGQIISAPTVQTEITSGEAVITGNFTLEEARDLVRRLNEGALPVPLELVAQQSVEASLGIESLQKSLTAGFIGIVAVIVFMVLYYRLLGLITAIALIIYSCLMVAIFKLSGTFTPWPITLTLSGIAGFILSLGMAVDANILIFERTREELRSGKKIGRALEEGFKRAWPSIRDGNVSTIITSLVLIWFGTSFIKGFALILIIGVLVSMFTAIVLVRIILRSVIGQWAEDKEWLILGGKKKESAIRNL